MKKKRIPSSQGILIIPKMDKKIFTEMIQNLQRFLHGNWANEIQPHLPFRSSLLLSFQAFARSLLRAWDGVLAYAKVAYPSKPIDFQHQNSICPPQVLCLPSGCRNPSAFVGKRSPSGKFSFQRKSPSEIPFRSKNARYPRICLEFLDLSTNIFQLLIQPIFIRKLIFKLIKTPLATSFRIIFSRSCSLSGSSSVKYRLDVRLLSTASEISHREKKTNYFLDMMLHVIRLLTHLDQ